MPEHEPRLSYRIRAWVMGLREAKSDTGMTWGDQRDNDYDAGRSLGRRLLRLP